MFYFFAGASDYVTLFAMEILQLDEENRQAAIKESVKVLRNGGLLIYPTETCYGLGADATSNKAIDLLLNYSGGHFFWSAGDFAARFH